MVSALELGACNLPQKIQRGPSREQNLTADETDYTDQTLLGEFYEPEMIEQKAYSWCRPAEGTAAGLKA